VRRFVPLALAATITLGPACAPDAPTADRYRPRLSNATPFDASGIPSYAGDHTEAYAYIDANLQSHVENLRRWVRQRSVSAQDDGIQAMAEMVRNDLRQLGFTEAEIVPTSGHPGVWGYYDAGAAKTLAVYMMYDVQPVEATGWSVNAFARSQKKYQKNLACR
jgi:hypothetical protein